MKKINCYIIPLLLTFIVCLTTISHPAAVDYVTGEALDIILYTDGTYSVDGGNTTTDEVYFYSDTFGDPDFSTYLYFKGGTAITYQYLLDNPDFSITFNLISASSQYHNSTIGIGYADTHKRFFNTNLSMSGPTSFTLNSQSKMTKSGTVQSYILSDFFSDSSNYDQSQKMLQSPILIYSNSEKDIWTLNTTGVTVGGTIDTGTGTDDETGTGGTTGGTEDEDTGILQGIKDFFTSAFDGLKTFFSELWDAMLQGWLNEWNAFLDVFNSIKTFFSDLWNGLFESMKNFFSELFAPILEVLELWKNREQASQSFGEGFISTLTTLIDKLKEATLNPVFEMFDNVNLESIAVLQTIYDFPIMKDLIIVVVGLAVFSGILMLLVTF